MRRGQRLPELLDQYLKYHAVEGHTPATVRHKRIQLGLFVRFLEAQGHSLYVGEVSTLDVLSHLEDLKARGRSPATVNTRYRAMHAWFSWLVGWEIIESSPMERLHAPKVPKVRKPFIDQAAFETLLSFCPLNTLVGARRQCLLWLMATTGMRRGEIWTLQLDSLDWNRGLIRVMGKGQKERWVPFHQQVQRVMLRYFQQRCDNLPCLWVTEEGERVSYHGIARDIYNLRKQAGVKWSDVCHCFRRTWAANSVRQGIPRPYAQAIAGWSTPEMLDRYVRAMEGESGAIEAYREFNPFPDMKKSRDPGK